MLKQIDQFGNLVPYPEKHPDHPMSKICFSEIMGPFHGEVHCCHQNKFSVRYVIGTWQSAVLITCVVCKKEHVLQMLEGEEK